MRIINIILILILSHCFLPLLSQELNANVTVVSPQVQSTDKHIYDNMREVISEFLRNTVWTTDKYQTNERIECNFYITIKEQTSTSKFTASLQVQSVRPIYNTSYNSPLLNIKDEDFSFDFIEFQKVEFVEGSFTSNLASVLAYYVYIILGLDYDSYSKFGGTEYFKKAMNIVNAAQGKSEYSGWDAFNTKKTNRYWFVYQMLDDLFLPIRECNYVYHRIGLDNMHNDKENARTKILESLEKFKKIQRDEPDAYLTTIFFQTKRDEIINVFSEALSAEKDQIIQLAKEIDGAKSSEYSDKLK